MNFLITWVIVVYYPTLRVGVENGSIVSTASILTRLFIASFLRSHAFWSAVAFTPIDFVIGFNCLLSVDEDHYGVLLLP